MTAREAVVTLFRLHYRIWRDGERVRTHYEGEGDPPPRAAGVLGFVREHPGAVLDALRGIEAVYRVTDGEIRRFQDLGKEIEIETPVGRLWLVPRHTDKPRLEVTWEEMRDDPWGCLVGFYDVAEAKRLFGGTIIRTVPPEPKGGDSDGQTP